MQKNQHTLRLKKSPNKALLILSCLLLIVCHTVSLAQNRRTAWFEEARFGMFIHWGLYSAAEGLWKGEKLRYANNYAEWIRYRNRISKEEYGQLANRFVWNSIKPEEWVLLAKKAGMKYIIMTAKHHDGVAIWDTKVGNYSLPKLSGVDRDVIAEIAAACRKHDMKLGFYYSHWIDWEHPYGWDHNQELAGHVTDEQYDQYWQQKVMPQLRELLTNYGDIALMWFDMWIPYQKTILKKQQLEQAVTLIHELQPHCLINSRLGLPTDASFVDFETRGDNEFGESYTDHPWETPGTIAHSWGYNGQEKDWKSTGQLFESLISNVALNGGFTLNIGPRADGTVPYESVSRLTELGHWLQQYGAALYGNTGLPLSANRYDWGKITRAKGSNTLYFHIFNWPLDSILRISGINDAPLNVELLRGNLSEQLRYERYGPHLHIQLPSKQSDPYVSVVRVSYDTISTDPKVAIESTFGGFALHARNALQAEELLRIPYDGKRPEHVKMNNGLISWKVYLYQAGRYTVDLSAHNPLKTEIPVTIEVDGQSIKTTFVQGGKVVSEPNENNYTEEFIDKRTGSFSVDRPGYYTLRFQTQNITPLWFNRLWVQYADK